MSSPTARRELVLGHVALVLVQLCFGLFPVFGKWAFEAFAPRAVAVWRIGFGALALTLLALTRARSRILPRRGDLALLALGALLGIVLNQALFLEGLARSTVINSGLIQTLIPVFTFALAVAVGQEHFSRRRAVGLVLALAGALVLLLPDLEGIRREHWVGNLLLIANGLCFSIYLILSRRLLWRYSPLAVIAWVYVLALWSTPLLGRGVALLPNQVSTRAWVSLGFILLFPTALGYLLNTYALARVPASTTAVYVYSQPLMTGLAGLWLMGERLSPAILGSGALLFAGIGLVIWPPRSARL